LTIKKEKKKWPFSVIFFLMLAGLMLLILFSLCVGRYTLPVGEVLQVLLSRLLPISHSFSSRTESIVLTLRLPRIIAAVLVGGALSLSGAAYQGVFQNPLVAPDLLGVSSGACIGASLAILAGAGAFGIQLSAFITGIVAVMLTTAIPRLVRNRSNMMLVLAGIIVTGLTNAIMGLIKYIADPETQLADITYWQMGSIAKVQTSTLAMVAPAIIISTIILMMIRWRVNVLSMGEHEAQSLGISTRGTRFLVIGCATLLTASAVCISGTIGWVGLVVPHLGRLIVGPDNSRLLPVSFVTGSIFMVLVDTLARTMTSAELPLSILTGLIGAPFYFYLLKRQRMNLS
jgi:iron complex transport system permease protein